MPLARKRIALSCCWLVATTAILVAPSNSTATAQPADPPPAREAANPLEAPPKTVDAPPQTEGVPLVKPGKLPWEKPDSKPSPLPAKQIASAREMLKALGIDDSQLANLFHGQPISPGEEEVLYRVLFRLPQFGLANFERWREKEPAWSTLKSEPDQHRARLYKVSGRATRVARKAVLPEVAQVLEFDHYFQVAIKLDEGHDALVCARTIPEAWPLDAPLDERVSCDGLFLKLGEPNGERPQLVFATLRLAWHPDKAGTFGVTEDLAWLGSHGFDVGSFDAPRARNQKPIGGTETECFYGLLSTLSHIEPAALQKHAEREFDLAPLLQDAKQHHGDVCEFRGIARRVQKVMLGEDDRDFRERYGIDHYFQVDVFIPLGDKQVQFSKGPNDPHGPVFVNDFLVTLCVLKVPPELKEGEYLDAEIRIPAVFYKIWEFPSDYVKKFGNWTMQPAPMLLGIEPVVLKKAASSGSSFSSTPFFNAGLALVAVVALLGVWYGLWNSSRGDKTYRQRAHGIQGALGNIKPVEPRGNQALKDVTDGKDEIR